MAENSILWTTDGTGDGDNAGYTMAEMTALFRSLCGINSTNLSGVIPDYLNELATTGTVTPVSTNTGAAFVYGFFYTNSSAVTTAIPTPAASTRIDRIVLRADWTAQTVRITKIAGTEGAGAPAITQSAGATWDFPIAQASITTGGVITVTDDREWAGMIGDDAVTAAKLLDTGDFTVNTITAAGKVDAARNTDTTSDIGRASIGYDGANSDHASFSHIDQNSGTTYALLASSSATGTFLNVGPGGTLYFRVNNVSQATLDATRLTVTNGMRAGYDTNATSTFGRAAVGYNGADSDSATFAHLDQNSAASYALKQGATGGTTVNSASGVNLNFAINDSIVGLFDASGNLGINGSPSYKLDVNGTVRAVGAAQFDSTVDITGTLTATLAANSIDSVHYVDGSIDTAHIGNLQVTTGKIAADAIDGTKLADNAVNSEHITAGAVDVAHMSANSVDSAQYVDGSIDTAHIGNLQVTTGKIAADAIDGTKLADNAVNSEHITAGAVDVAHMSANSVDSAQYVDGSIDTIHIAADQITSALIADDQIDSEHIAVGAVDNEHMAANSIDSAQYVDGSIDAVHLAAGVGGVGIAYIPIANDYSTTASTSYVFPTTGGISFDPDDWPAGATMKYVAMMDIGSSETAYSQLYDLTGSAAITGSEVTTSSATRVIVTSADIRGNLTSGDRVYIIQIKTSNAGVSTVFFNSYLLIEW